jgi:X-Pro dipeptidyl-peptidase (S15 family)./Dienelactone hydrolase family.
MFISILVFAILLLSAAIGFYFSSAVIKPKVWAYAHTYEIETESGRIDKDKFEKLQKEEIYIKSPYGYLLHGLFFPSDNSSKAVIICHGITYSLLGCAKYMELFTRRGYNILLYDHRNHGKSGGKNTTFGFYEKYDLKACTDWIIKRCGNQCRIGTMGESLGAATVLQNLAIDSRILFFIADCSYSDLMELLKFRMKTDYHLPAFPFLYISSFINNLRGAMYYGDVSPIRDISKIETPVLFIHGADDCYIPKQMSIDMYNIKPGIKELHLFPNADHVQSYLKNKSEYAEAVDKFLDSVNM